MKRLKLSGVERKKAFLGLITRMVRSKALEVCSGAEGRLIDVACGNGIFAAALSARRSSTLRIFALDKSFSILLEARRIFQDNSVIGVNLLCADALKMPFKKGSFDTVVCINTFLNLSEKDLLRELIAALGELCSQGGRLIFDYRNARNPLLKAKYWLHRRRQGPATTGHELDDYLLELAKNGLKVAGREAVGLPHDAAAFAFLVEARKGSGP